MDPGSSDGSREWLADNPHDRLITVLEPDSGPADGLNKGLARAQGEIFVYLNSDDELAPGGLDLIRSHFDDNPEADVVVGNGWIIDEAGTPIKYILSDRFTPIRFALGIGIVLQQATGYRMSSLERLGISFNEQNRLAWDAELLFDLQKAGARFHYTDDVLGYFRVYDGTITTTPENAEAHLRERHRLVVATGTSRYPRLLDTVGFPLRALKYARNLPKRAAAFETFPGLA